MTRGVKPNPDALDARRAKVADLLVEGYSYRRIAAKLGYALASVQLDVKAVRRGWHEYAWRSFGELVDEQLYALLKVERHLWELFELAGAERRTSTAKTVSSNGVRRDEASESREPARIADMVAILKQIAEVVEQRYRILGIKDAPKLLPPRVVEGPRAEDTDDHGGGELSVAEVRDDPERTYAVLQMIVDVGGIDAWLALKQGDEDEDAIDV